MSRTRRTSSALVLLVVVLGSACSPDKKPTIVTPPPPTFTGPLTAQQFHNVGAVAGALPLAPGETAAARLRVDQPAVDNYVASVCAGHRPSLNITLSSFASQIAAYEAIFAYATTYCGSSTETQIAQVRGDIASSIANNVLNRTHFPSQNESRFCEQLDATEPITSPLITAALSRLHVDEDLLEIGMSILVKSCPLLLNDLGN
jgi:hypothetical protein